jgi:hypothetical protein
MKLTGTFPEHYKFVRKPGTESKTGPFFSFLQEPRREALIRFEIQNFKFEIHTEPPYVGPAKKALHKSGAWNL